MNEEDRKFLEAIDKRCYAEQCREGSHHYWNNVALTEDELLRIFAICEEDDSLLLLPTTTPFGFGGPCFTIIQAERTNAFVVESTQTRLCNFSLKKHVPAKWKWEDMVRHFPPERLMSHYGIRMYSVNAWDYDY